MQNWSNVHMQTCQNYCLALAYAVPFHVGMVSALLAVREMCRTGEAKQLREASGLSLTEIATELKVAPTTVHRWENGQVVPRRGDHALEYHRLLIRLQRRLAAVVS